MLSPSWLDGAQYQATTNVGGEQAYKWRVSGLQPNYYYAAVNDGTPLELDQVPNDYQVGPRPWVCIGPSQSGGHCLLTLGVLLQHCLLPGQGRLCKLESVQSLMGRSFPLVPAVVHAQQLQHGAHR